MQPMRELLLHQSYVAAPNLNPNHGGRPALIAAFKARSSMKEDAI